MPSEWTLPLIRIELDGLPLGCDFILASDDAERLFGETVEMAATFAAGHGCRTVLRKGDLVFEKRMPSGRSASATDPASVECFPSLCPPPNAGGDDHPGPGCR